MNLFRSYGGNSLMSLGKAYMFKTSVLYSCRVDLYVLMVSCCQITYFIRSLDVFHAYMETPIDWESIEILTN